MAQKMSETSRTASRPVGTELMRQLVASRQGPQPFQAIADAFFRLDPARLGIVTGGMRPLPPNSSQQEMERAALRLYGRLVADRPGGIAYEFSGNRMPKTPAEVIRAPMRADCDELAMLFIAAARALNIDTAGMSLGVLNLHTNRPGSLHRERHAALFVSGLNGRNYLMDFTFENGPWPVGDFSPSAISARYRGLRVSLGPRAGHTIISATPTLEVSTQRDIAAYALIDRAVSMGNALGNGTASATDLRRIMEALNRASGAAASDQLRLKIAELYAIVGERAYSDRRTTVGPMAFAAGLAVFSSLPQAVRQKNANIQYRLGIGAARAYENSASMRPKARQLYDEMVKLNPSGPEGYSGAYRMRLTALDADMNANRRTEAQRGINEMVAMLRAGIRNAGSDIAMLTELQGHLDTVSDRARARGYVIPPVQTP